MALAKKMQRQLGKNINLKKGEKNYSLWDKNKAKNHNENIRAPE